MSAPIVATNGPNKYLTILETAWQSHLEPRKPDPDRPMFSIPKEVTNRGAFSITHWTEKRLLSVSELKRLSSYPDDFVFAGKFTEQWARIGNSVPPLFMKAIADHIRCEILGKVVR